MYSYKRYLLKRSLESLMIVLITLSPTAMADSFCFSYAENYYEQLYCEIKASGKGTKLPSLYDFRRNNERMQALVLKPFARRAGIELVMPKKARVGLMVRRKEPVDVGTGLSGCQREQALIRCGGRRYQLLTNKPNTLLAANVLSDTNAMGVTTYQGSQGDSLSVQRYLLTSYQRYIEKMVEIGLAGSLMSYAKFEYLFYDLKNKGVDFGQRFEKMFYYLKREKQRIAVSSRAIVPAELSLDSCYTLEPNVLCSVGGKNYLFIPQT